MSEELVIRCCAPTLASLKTANMFTCRFDSLEEMNAEVIGIIQAWSKNES